MPIFNRFKTESLEPLKGKIRIYAILAVFSFLCLWMRIWYLQILRGDSFEELAKNNRVRMVSISPFRGELKDRNAETMVGVRPSFNLYITPEDVENISETLDFLERKISFNRKILKKNIKRTRSFKNILIKADVSREDVAFVEENKMRLPGIQIQAEPLRSYKYGKMAAHVFGYLGEISKDKLKEEDDDFYRLGDLVGKDGIEKIFEPALKGKKGFKEVEVDVSGRELGVLRKLPPVGGNVVTLTLDSRLQKVAEEELSGKPGEPYSGALALIKVKTGEILAMASKPSFDPNLFAGGISRRNWRKLLFDEMHPLQNRVVQGQYPPGSVHKIVVALAGLEEGIVDENTTFYCPGHFKLGRGRYRCWKKSGHGKVNIHKAIRESCDVYFYHLGHKLGVDTIARYAKRLGLGALTGIPLIGEKPGLAPTREWKKKSKNENWYGGETISVAIGQGFNLVTPLQQAVMLAGVANNGVLMKPSLVKKIETPNGQLIKKFSPVVKLQDSFSEQSLETIRKGLRAVVNENGGTGRRSRLKDIIVSGKTGTAQVIRMKSGEIPKEEETPFLYRDHAWFAAFAPYEDPEIAISVLVEHGGHGGSASAPIAKKMIEKYFELYPVSPKPKAKPGAFPN